MNRRPFATGLCAAVALGMPFAAAAASLVGKRTTQVDLLAAMPSPGDGDWIRLTLGSGVAYGKQIGFGTERTHDGRSLLYVESQIGQASGACNPNTTRKTYLTSARFGALLSEYAVLASVARSGNMITRWADREDGQPQSPRDARLRLLDAPYVYDDRPLTIESVEAERVHVDGRAHDTTKVVASFAGDAESRLQRIQLWHTPTVPFGVAKYHAVVRDLEPFELTLETFGRSYKPDLSMSLEAIRAMTGGGAVGILQPS